MSNAPIRIQNDSDFLKKLSNFLFVNCETPLRAKMILDKFVETFVGNEKISRKEWDAFCREIFNNGSSTNVDGIENEKEDLIDINGMINMFEFVFPKE